jgi:hypothetical protein
MDEESQDTSLSNYDHLSTSSSILGSLRRVSPGGRIEIPPLADQRESELKQQRSDLGSALTLQPVPVSALQKLKGR